MEPIGIIPNSDQHHKDNAINSNFRDIARRLNPVILKDTSGIARKIEGRLPDGTYGTKVSKEGVDVTTASDTDLVYKSDFSTDIYYDDTHPRIMLGALPDGTFGLVVSREGNDVTELF